MHFCDSANELNSVPAGFTLLDAKTHESQDTMLAVDLHTQHQLSPACAHPLHAIISLCAPPDSQIGDNHVIVGNG